MVQRPLHHRKTTKPGDGIMSEKVETMRKLADWIETFEWTVYYNQKNKDGYEVFHGPSSKPDMLIRNNGYNVLVEVKTGSSHQDILNGYQQTLDYAGKYWSGRTSEYYRDDKDEELKIDAFVLATKYSIDGYLYGKEQNTNTIDYSGYLAKEKHMDEYPITHTVNRMMWREWESGKYSDYFRDLRRDRSNSVLTRDKPKVGTLVSKVDAETKQSTVEPHFYLNSNQFVPAEVNQIYAFN